MPELRKEGRISESKWAEIVMEYKSIIKGEKSERINRNNFQKLS